MAPCVGFDFDECLVQAYTMVPFILLFELLIPKALSLPNASKSVKFFLNKATAVFYDHVATNEIKTKGTIFRPSLLRLLPALIKLRQQGKVNKLFIYSNNGINELLNVIDHILALILQKQGVNAGELIQETDGRLHALTPRIHIDNPCRASVEVKDADGFREKTLQGIQACLGESVMESELWFLDDTKYHKKLMDMIKEQYIVVEPYSVNIANKRLAEMFIDSFPLEFFTPGSPVAAVLLTEVNRIMPGFRPTTKETKQSLTEKFTKVLNKFSPGGAGRVMSVWKEDHVNSDYKSIEKQLHGVMHQKQPTVSTAYSAPIGGRRHSKLLPVSSRSRKNRRLFTRRRNRK